MLWAVIFGVICRALIYVQGFWSVLNHRAQVVYSTDNTERGGDDCNCFLEKGVIVLLNLATLPTPNNIYFLEQYFDPEVSSFMQPMEG